ncbi:glycine betaine ABC transporter substrate-binding protein [Sediminivirga luteola]|uniref:glycine betaine ABC transporter substrate-binding protein n=1 Tax=Sediminivirga luteola TaxID=1774748 RepID=UPI001F568103|nr:glycine betaine ABC transporter substrate-binding protein [Sediminivirga luteola]MCI2265003.1 glycine betaine ABC transporter substrate-binding protein [Sediminivirga luteola]
MKLANLSKASGFLAAGALLLAGCGATNTGEGETPAGDNGAAGNGGSAWDVCDPIEDSADLSGLEPEGGEIVIATINGWDDTVTVGYLYKALLEDAGYTPVMEAHDAGPAFLGTSQGDIDVLTSTMMPVAHAEYIDQYGDDMEAQGCYYEHAVNTLAVNEDSPAQSIADLPEFAGEYGNRIVGIEPGAGLTQRVENEVTPGYGLEDYEFITSSTPAMLAELDSAVESGENIVVTLWHPHWAYDAWPVRDLEDPDAALGEGESLWLTSRTGFTEDHPYAAQLLKNILLDEEQFSSLQSLMMSEDHYGGEDPDAAVAEWLEDNPDYADQLRAGTLA